MTEPPVGSPLSLYDPRRVGPWQIHSRLGSGGMGVVYYATSEGRRAALKVIRPGLLDSPATRERFSREVAILRAVRDVHISQFIDADLDAEPAWLAIEYLSGPVLRDEVAQNGPLSQDDWWSLARGLAQALAVLEIHRITHRDLKPGNVILHERGPVLIDFGIAVPEDATSLTATGLVTGSPAWLSPEQANLEHTGPASDVFALGSLLAFAATGRPPFGEGMSVAVLMSISSREPDLAGVDPARSVLLRRMLAKDPTARPTAKEVLGVARLGPQSLGGLAGLVGPEEAYSPSGGAALGRTRHLDSAAPAPGSAPRSTDPGATSETPVSRTEATGAFEVPKHDTLPGVPLGADLAAEGASAGGRPGPVVPPGSGRSPATSGLPTTAPRERTPAATSRRRVWLLVALVGATLLVLLGWLVLRPSGGGQPSGTPSPTASASATAPSAPASDQLRDGQWLLESYRLSNQGGSLVVSGSVRNTGTAAASADLQVWAYQGGQSLGSVSTTVKDVPAGGAVDVTMTGDATWQAGQKVLLLQAS